MESFAHEFSTGIPMSTKGIVDHLYATGLGVGSPVAATEKTSDFYDSKSTVSALINNISRENGDCFISSVQDGDQSQLLYNIVCSSDELSASETSSYDSSQKICQNMVSNIKCSIEEFCQENSLSSADIVAHNLEEPLEGIQLSLNDFKFLSKNSDLLTLCFEEHKKSSENITGMSNSLGIEILPDVFQEDSIKDAIIGVVSDHELGHQNANGQKNAIKVSVTEVPEWPDDDFLNLSSASISPKMQKDIVLSKEIYDTSITDPDDIVTENMHFSNSISSVNTLTSATKCKVNTKRDHNYDRYEITNEMVECILESNSNDYSELQDNNNDSSVNNYNDQVPLIHLSEANLKSIGLDNTSAHENKVQIIVSTDDGDKIFEFDKDFAASLNIISSIDKKNLEKSSHTKDSSVQGNESSSVLCNKANNIEVKKLQDFVKKLSTVGQKKRASWVCSVKGCEKVLKREQQLKTHMLMHMGERPYKCSKTGCTWAFTTLYRLRRHEETHFGNKDYSCDYENCDKSFTTIYNLNAHKKRHKWPNLLLCPATDCDMSFASRRKLELHLKIHDDVEAPYKCWICHKKYYSANCIASHNRSHQHDEDDFKCPFPDCGKKYDKVCRLKQHIRFHTGERPYSCPEEGCKWSFVSASKLTRHMRKHTGERKFVCSEPGCGKSFMRPEHLKGHIVIHTGDKPFKCPKENCNAKFTAKSSLYVHMKKHNNNDDDKKPFYYCPVISCGREYNTKATLRQHLQKTHAGINLSSDNIDNPLPNLISIQTPDDSDLRDNKPPPKIITRIVSSKEISCKSATSSCRNRTKNDKFTLQSSDHSSSNITSKPIGQLNIPKSVGLSSKIGLNIVKCKIFQENQSGSARTDYCYNQSLNNGKKLWTLQNRIHLGVLSNNDGLKSNSIELANQNLTNVNLEDIAATSSNILLQEQINNQLDRVHFSPEEASNGIVYSDSILINNLVFTSDLSGTSYFCDSFDTNGSVITPIVTSACFVGQNSVDELSDPPIGLQCFE